MPHPIAPTIPELLLRHREMREHGLNPSAAEVCHDSPELLPEFVQALADSNKFQGWVEASQETPVSDETGDFVPMASVPVPHSADFGSRLTNVRYFAKGGMGVVLLATDPELNVEVIVKMIHTHLANRPEMVTRFLWEAGVTARLHHPGIPPVHGVGRATDGRPCYVMRYIAGEEMGQAIEKVRIGKASFRDLLGRFVTVCRIVGYAHSQGVIHRDLKPANIRLGQFGETIVLDWGLAKVNGQGVPGIDERERPMGTRGYWAPEQELGRQDEVDERSDVFSLGATLRDILGLDAPKPLTAIVSRAVERLPEKRYQSALRLAEDVERWLADEPLSVFRDRLPVRVARHARKRPITSTIIGTGIAVAVVGLVVGLLAVTREQAKTAKERDEKEMARQEAVREKNDKEVARQKEADGRNLLWLALDEAVGTIGPLLGRQQELRKEDKEFLRVMIGASDRAAKSAPEDPESQMKKGRMYHDIAHIYIRLGDDVMAEKYYLASIKTKTPVCRAFPSNMTYCQNLAASWDHLGHLLKHNDRLDEADKAYRSALTERRRLLDSDPTNARYRLEFAMSHNHLGLLYHTQERPQEARRSFEDALAILEEITNEYPKVPLYRETLAHAIHNRGGLSRVVGRMSEALDDFRAAEGHYARLVQDMPKKPQYRFEQSTTLHAVAVVAFDVGLNDEAERASRTAVEIQTKFVDEYPGLPSYREELIRTLEIRANILQGANRHADAEKCLRSMLKHSEAGLKASSTNAKAVLTVPATRLLIGFLLDEMGNDQGALDELNRADAELSPSIDKKAAALEAQSVLASIVIQRAVILGKLGKKGEALKEMDRAEVLGKGTNPANQFGRAVALVRIGEVQRGLEAAEVLLGLKALPPGQKPLSPQKFFYAALPYALASDPGKGRAATPEREKYAKRAIELLQKARELKVFRYHDELMLLRVDASLGPIRQREDFKQLLRDVEADLKPKR